MKNIFLKIIYKILAFYAKKTIIKNNPIVIAVTGSVGKSSTKEAIFSVLNDLFNGEVRKNEGNLNTEIGVPLTILGYKSLPNKFLWPFFLIGAGFRINQANYPKYLILEMGVEKPGDIKYLTDIVKPDLAVITSTTPAHILNFKDISEYQQEKISLINYLKNNGKVFINCDDSRLSRLTKDDLKTISIINKQSDYFADEIEETIFGTEFRINCTGRKISVKSKLLGRQLIYAQLFAFAIADMFGASLIKVGKSLSKINPYPGRMNLLFGKNNSIIIDDTYNSNPTSLKAALDVLGEIKHNGRKVAIIGNMNELGQMEKNAHLEIGNYTQEKCDLAIFVGKNAEVMASGFGKKENCLTFRNRFALEDVLDKIIKPEDLVLVKASQNGNFFEEIVKKLMKNPEDAGELLVRQSRSWQKKKRN